MPRGEGGVHAIYGSPMVQAMLGMRASDGAAPAAARPGAGGDAPSSGSRPRRCAARIGEGGLREALIRALIYIRLPQLAAGRSSSGWA